MDRLTVRARTSRGRPHAKQTATLALGWGAFVLGAFSLLAGACGEGESGGGQPTGGASTGGSSVGASAGSGGMPTTTSGTGNTGTGGAGGADDGRCAFQIGWTRDVQGGLGGEVIRVTTLDRDGPGSLQEALSTEGPRVIVFEVGGVIDLETDSMRVNQPYVTIAGQTAPSPGITLIRGTLSISTHDVVVQHLRVRPGEAGQTTSWEPDGISIVSGHDVVVDHCSVSWSIDENLSASGPRFEGATADDWREGTSRRVTLHRNIVAEALSNSTHSKGEHSKGSLIHDNVTDILIAGNLYASNVDRNPLFKGGARGAVVNNFVTNSGRYAVTYGLVESEWVGYSYELGQMAVVGNVFRHGIDTDPDGAFMRVSGVGPVQVYLADNVAEDIDGQPVVELVDNGGLAEQLTAAPLWPDGLVALSSATMHDALQENVGARPWDRDAIDARIVAEAFAGTGQQIDHEDEGGGYPTDPPTSATFVASDWDECFERIE